MKLNNSKIRRLSYLIVASLLLMQVFPMHVHIHNHIHTDSNKFMGSELSIMNFENDPLKNHEHAQVVDMSNDYLLNNDSSTVDLPFLLVIILLFLPLISYGRRYCVRNIRFRFRHLFYLPLLRAPPAQT